MPSVEAIMLLIVGVAFIAIGLYMSYKKSRKSTDKRLEEIYRDYNKQMDRFRK